MEYIDPNLKKFDTLKELLKSTQHHFFFEPTIRIEELFHNRKNIAISEPGLGKTRLLKEILFNAKDKEGIFLDLKRLKKKSIFSFINEYKNIDILNKNNINKEIELLKIWKTENFELRNSSKNIFCFDALDEVKNNDLAEVIDNIKNFMKDFNESYFFISYRKSYINKWQHLFSEIDFKYIEILPLDRDKLIDYLKKYGVNKEDIDNLLGMLNFQNRSSILSSPRYLEMIAEIIKTEGLEKIKSVKRNELFERFIYKKLIIESEKNINLNCNNIIKMVLEKLALVMEIYQANQISKDELMEFFDNTKSNLNITFLNQVPINYFYERSLLKDNIDSVEFENTEFQEYLAAKEILRLGRVEQVVFDLSVVKELGEIHPSWLNTLSFLIEFKSSLLRKVLEYVFSNPESIHLEEHIKLITKSKYNLEEISTEDKRVIFKIVYLHYQKVSHWIDYDIAEKLSFYYDQSLYDLIKSYINNRSIKREDKQVKKSNSATLIAFLLDRKILTYEQKSEWGKRFKRFLNKKNQNEVVMVNSLFALSKYKNTKLFTPHLIEKLFKTKNDRLISELVDALSEIDPNHPKTIDCIVRGINLDNMAARHALGKVNDKEAIKRVLSEFIADNDFINKFVEHESIYTKTDQIFIENIKRTIDKDLLDKLKMIINKIVSNRIKFIYILNKAKFIQEFALIIKEYSSKYIFELLKNCSKIQDVFAIENLLTNLLEKEDVEDFIEIIKGLDNGSTREAVQILQQVKYSDRKDKKDIYEEGRKYLREEYKNIEDIENQYGNKQHINNLKIYEQFKHKLEPEKNKYQRDVFEFYLEKKDILDLFIKEEDMDRLKKFVEFSVFKVFDPGTQKLTIERKNGEGFTYTTNVWIRIFSTCILLAKELHMDISTYRQKILNYIPFSYSDEYKTIIELIPNPSSQEINNVLKLYKNRDDDLIIFRPRNIIDLSDDYNIEQSVPILKNFVKSNQIDTFDRKAALNAISNIGKETKDYFQNIFNEFLKEENNYKEIAYVANEILIKKYKEKSAIKWRFDKIKHRAFPFKMIEGVHSVNWREKELLDKEFASPLVQLKNTRYIEMFLDLLEYSFELRNKGEAYFEYASYLWDIVIDYFKNLKEMRNYKVLEELENYINKNSKKDGMNWFKYRFQKLKLEYVIFIGKPLNIADCIKKYNFYKEKIYLDVATEQDLIEVIKRAINEGLKRWIEYEGAYKFIDKYKPKDGKNFRGEDLIQKTIKTQFENELLKVGLRIERANLQRETQMLDDKKTDFLIYYGFIGPVLIETKLSSNKEITNKKEREKYKNKLIQYTKGTNSIYCIFLIFQIDKKNLKEKHLPLLEDIYKKEKNIKIEWLKCI
jgi:DNA polymerase III delta prime subunit